MIEDRFPFLNLFGKFYKLIRFWNRFQISAIVFCFLSWAWVPLVADKINESSGKFALLGSIAFTALLLVILSFVGISKVLPIYKLTKQAFELIKPHSNQVLVSKFKKLKSNLFWILFLESLFVITFPFSILLKISFGRNVETVEILFGCKSTSVEKKYNLLSRSSQR